MAAAPLRALAARPALPPAAAHALAAPALRGDGRETQGPVPASRGTGAKDADATLAAAGRGTRGSWAQASAITNATRLTLTDKPAAGMRGFAARALAEQPQAVTLAVLVQRTQSDVVVDLAPPLTLDSVKRKRKRKMNKHKHRKRRKRDRGNG